MSKTVDQRVVEMRFDNREFESNVKTSLSTIDRLKQSLNFSGAAKGIEDIGTAAKKCDMSGIGSAVDAVKVKFSALEVMAVSALSNITNSALNAGKNIVSALTLDPIKTGFQEYETQINAVQTILANTSSKGTTLDQVNSALDELNHYADMTIYNFTEMTRNIGTFTAAGVDLDTSVSAIKGIANLAAVSGSTSQQASTAMYQLSQALAAGTVKLQDWNSVVNAGMGGQVFQDALKETAKVHGIAIDEMIADEGSFRETLSKGWLTSEILTETLSKFTGDLNEQQLKAMNYTDEQIKSIMKMGQTANDAATKVKTFTQLFDTLKEAAQSGWTQSWEIIVGDFEEAKAFLTEISDTFSGIIGASADARNTVLQEWKDLGGRTVLIDSFRNAFEGVLSVIKPVKEAFSEIFPPVTGKQLVEITEKVRNLTAKFKIGDTTAKNLKSTFKGFFAVLDIVAQAFKAVAGGVADLVGFALPAGDGILGLTGKFGDYLTKLDDSIKKTNLFNTVIKNVVNFIKAGVSTITEVLGGAGNAVNRFRNALKERFTFPGLELFHEFLKQINERMFGIGESATGMKNSVSSALEAMGHALENCRFLQLLQSLWKAVTTVVGGILQAFGDLTGVLAKKIGNANFSGIFDFLNALSLGGIAVGITKFVKGFSDSVDGLGGILENVTGILDGVKDCLSAYQEQIKSTTLLKIAGAIAILAASIVAISLIDSEKLSAAIGGITMLFANLVGAMAIMGKIDPLSKDSRKAMTSMIAMSAAVLILANAMKTVSELDWVGIAKGLTGVAGLSTIMVVAAKAMSSGSGHIIKGATQMVIFAAAIKILASVCEDLSNLEWNQLGRGLTGVGVLMAEVSLFLNTAKLSGKAITTATGIVILAAGIKVLASACQTFSTMKWGEIGKGLAATGTLLAEVALFTNLTGNAKHVLSTSVSLTVIAAAMKIFASAMEDFSKFSWEQIAKGLVAMGGALAEVAIAAKLMPKNMMGIGTGLVIAGAALAIVADVLNQFKGYSWEEIGKGLIVLGGALAELSLGLNLMTGTIGGSAALLVASAALLVLTPVLAILGSMSWESIAKGLITVAGAFAILGVAGAILGPLVPAILGLSGAFALIGVSVLAAGAGLLAAGAGLSAIAVGITALAASLAAGVTSIVAAITAIVMGIAGLIPAIVEKMGEAIVAVCKVIIDAAPAIGEAVISLVKMLAGVLVECVPEIADGALQLVAGVLEALVKYAPTIIDSLFTFLIEVLEGIAQKLPALIKAAVDVIMAFFSGVADVLSGIDTDTLLKGIVGIGLLSAIMVALGATAALIPGAMAGVLGMGLVIAELALVLAAVGALAQIPGLSWLIGEGGKLLEGIGTAIGQFIGGIVGGFMSGVSSQFPKIGKDLSAFMTNVQPFIAGASKINSSAMEGVRALAQTILILTAADILQGLASWFTGGSSLAGFAEQLVPFGKAMNDFSKEIAGLDGELVANAATAGKTLAEMAATIPNSGGVIGFFTGNNDMDAFGKQLVPFGKAMMEFSKTVKGLDADSVANSATAGKALAELAKTVPNSGGAVGFFAGNNDMDAFGKQLIPFGKAMKTYADSVSGIDAEAVTNSATAGKAIVELANTLPNTGGIVSWFTGDNDIGAFGTSLVAFGEHFARYSDFMKNVDAGIVVTTTNAANSIVELQKSLPKEGGWFSNDMTLASFGSDIASFGLYFSTYYGYISGVNASQLSAVIGETDRLISVARGMSGLDTSAVSGFGKALTDLANNGITGFIGAFDKASSKVSTAASNMLKQFINGANAKKGDLTSTFTALVQAVITAINAKQAEFQTAGSNTMLKFVTGVKTQANNTKTTYITIVTACLTVIKNKYQEFQQVGTQTMVKFIAGVKSQEGNARTTFINIISSCLTAIKNKYGEFTNVGKECMTKFISGVKSQEENSKTAVANIISACLTEIKNKFDDFESAGKSCMEKFIEGVKSKTSSIKEQFTDGLSDVVKAIKEYYDEFSSAGAYLVEGLADGIDKNIEKAAESARKMAKAAAKAAKDELDEHSPSKVGYQIGDYFGIAFINALISLRRKSYEAGSGIAKAAKEGLQNAVSRVADIIENGLDSQPEIRPVLDLSSVEAGAKRLNAIFSREQALSISSGMMHNQQRTENQNGGSALPTGNTFTFTQNNYSPKALSRLEIYRQTKNQFSAMREAVGNV